MTGTTKQECRGKQFGTGRVTLLWLLGVLFLAARPVSAQVELGIPPFASMSPPAFDTVNEANNNAVFFIPIVNKAGRGMPFTYSLVYNTSVWTSSGSWTPAGSWGWGGSTSANFGSTAAQWTQGSCRDLIGHWFYWDIWNFRWYYDPTGAGHPLGNYGAGLTLSDYNQTGADCAGDGWPYQATVTLADGSGYTLYWNLDANYGFPEAQVWAPSGNWGYVYPGGYNLQGATVQVSDTNGNTEKYYTSTSNVVTYTDTLGATVLTATPGSTSTTYAYTGPDGNSHNYTVNYTQKTVQTYFGCSGIGEYGPTAKYLVSSVVLPDGTQYLFQYEPTPNYPNNVTGRLAQVTLPTGGTVQYAYSGGSNGISCTDYTVPTLTRTVTPGDGSAQGLWTYARTENSSTSWSTTVTDPAQNQTVIQFTASLNAGFTFPGALETERKINSGASTLMETVDTCYNNASIPCTSSSGVTLPIINRTVQTTLAGVAAKTYTTYNNYALPQVVDEYNYLLAFVRETMTCYASLTNTYIQNRPSSVVVYVSVRWTQETYCDGFHS